MIPISLNTVTACQSLFDNHDNRVAYTSVPYSTKLTPSDVKFDTPFLEIAGSAMNPAYSQPTVGKKVVAATPHYASKSTLKTIAVSLALLGIAGYCLAERAGFKTSDINLGELLFGSASASNATAKTPTASPTSAPSSTTLPNSAPTSTLIPTLDTNSALTPTLVPTPVTNSESVNTLKTTYKDLISSSLNLNLDQTSALLDPKMQGNTSSSPTPHCP